MPQHFKFFVGLLELRLHLLLVEGIALARGVLGVTLMPFGDPLDGAKSTQNVS